LQIEKNHSILESLVIVGKNLKILVFLSFCDKQGIHQECFAPITHQQNGVVERTNRVVQKMAWTMLIDKKVAMHY
jgi:hypothetical protein